MRLDHYYSGLLRNGRRGAPSYREARDDLRPSVEARFPYRGR